jgi:tRNA threonylcarbamoyladenosine biosynthesis protein TsaB
LKILGIETSTMMVGVAIVDGKGLVAEYRLEATRSRSERVMPMIDRVLKDSRTTPENLAGIAVSIGPGSFTGLRIGLSTAKGLAFALKLPIVGVSSLDVLAASAAMTRCAYPICPVLDARRQEVYAALFRADPEGELKKIVGEEAVTPAGLMEKLSGLHEPILFLGTGALLYETMIREKLGERAIFDPGLDPYPSPSMVAQSGMKRLMKGGGDDPSSLVPLYLSRLQAKMSL